MAKVLELQLPHRSFQWLFRVDFLSDWLVWPPCSPGTEETLVQKDARSLFPEPTGQGTTWGRFQGGLPSWCTFPPILSGLTPSPPLGFCQLSLSQRDLVKRHKPSKSPLSGTSALCFPAFFSYSLLTALHVLWNLLAWPKISFRVSIVCYQKSKQTCWPTQYLLNTKTVYLQIPRYYVSYEGGFFF